VCVCVSGVAAHPGACVCTFALCCARKAVKERAQERARARERAHQREQDRGRKRKREWQRERAKAGDNQYGVATIGRLLNIKGFFCKRAI